VVLIGELDGMEAVEGLFHFSDRRLDTVQPWCAATVYRSNWESDGGKSKGGPLIAYLVVIKSLVGSFPMRGVRR
jgi:hypothetical protein